MNRQTFLDRLREGLGGMPAAARDEILADYAAHFAEAQSAGRTEEDVAEALGDPARLARELRAEAGVRRWEAERNPTAAFGAVIAVLGLGAFDLLILLPVLLGVGAAMFGLSIASIAVFFAGSSVFASGLFHWPLPIDGTPVQGLLVGLGLMSGAAAFAALLMLFAALLVNLLVRYARLHYRLLKPAVTA